MNVPTPKSLGFQSRSLINKSVRTEDLDSLPLPQVLKDECFENVAGDRSDEPARQSLDPCDKGCCSFRTCEIRDCSKESKFEAAYDSTLSGLPTSADWLEMPDRESLLSHYKANPRRQRRLACLNTLRFDPTTGLGDVHEWIRRFLYYENVHGFYHVSVTVDNIQSFLEAIKNFDVVLLPYGCVGEHRRRMILAVKDADYDYKLALLRMRTKISGKVVTNVFINSVEHLISTIAYVSRTTDKHCVVFNPVVWHAIWWMHLLVPGGHLDRYANFRMDTEKKRAHASTELGIENCVVRFDPLHQFIGEPVEDLVEHVTQNRPFVFWFGGRVLNVQEMKDVPSFVIPSEQRFVQWCVSRQMNTLLNLNGNSWVDGDPEFRSIHEVNSMWDGHKWVDFEDDLSDDDDEEFNWYEGHVFDERFEDDGNYPSGCSSDDDDETEDSSEDSSENNDQKKTTKSSDP